MARLCSGSQTTTLMRAILFAVAMIGAASVLASADAMAQHYHWCSQGTGADNCGFVTYEQCRANIAGIGGKVHARCSCGAAAGRQANELDRPAPTHADPVREKPRYTKQGSTKQDSPMRPAAATGISVRSGAERSFRCRTRPCSHRRRNSIARSRPVSMTRAVGRRRAQRAPKPIPAPTPRC